MQKACTRAWFYIKWPDTFRGVGGDGGSLRGMASQQLQTFERELA